MNKKLFSLLIVLIFFFNHPIIFGADCFPPCTPTPCPELLAGTEIIVSDLNPTIKDVEQGCANPDGIDTAEEWANYLGISAVNGEDKDIRIDKYWEQKEPACNCVLKSNDPVEIWDIIYKKWEFIGDAINLTNDKQYFLKHIWYNKERRDSKGCLINYIDNEKNRIAIINVNYFAPVVDQLPSPGNPITNAPYQIYDCDLEMYHDGTLSATPYWENVGPTVNSACNESCSLNQTISINISIGFQAGIKHVIVGIIGANWAETESYSATGSCSSKTLKRRQLKSYQKGYYTIRDFEWGFFKYDEQQQKCLKAPVDNFHIEETIWKYEIIYNCATYAMDPPSGS